MSTGHQIVRAVLGGDAAGAAGLLAPDATFHSPATDYHGRERIAVILAAVARVVNDVTPATTLEAPGETVAFFTATIEGRHADGVVRVRSTDDAPATDLTLMIRPVGALLRGIERMKQLLD